MAAVEEGVQVVEESSEEDEPEDETEREDADILGNEGTIDGLENDGTITRQTLIPPQPVIVHTPQLPNLALAALQRLAANKSEESPDDFRPLKRRRVHPAAKMEGKEEEDTEEECDEGQCCSICFEPWSNSGIHRIASLKCGHLFGYGCIDKWLKAQDGRCPQCNSKAKKKDIRVIFAKSISVVDTTERDRALQELAEEKQAHILAQKSEAQSLLQYQLAKVECERIRTELKEVRKQLESYAACSEGAGPESSKAVPVTIPTMASSDGGSFEFLKTIHIASNGGARVTANDPSLGMIVASKKSSNQLFPGYGLTKLSLLDLKASEFVPVHEGQIRDVVFSPRGDGLTLTASVDKALKLTSMISNQVVQSYAIPTPAWGCCWNNDDPNYIFCGLSNGTLLTFDLRQTTGHVSELKVPNRGVPVTSLAYVPLCRASCLNCSGILAGTLEGVVFWEKDKDSYAPHFLDDLSGSCTSVSFEEASRHCLASFRPSKRTPRSRHTVYQLQNTPLTEPFSCNVLHQFTGGCSVQRLLSRSLLFQRPHCPGRLLVAYGEEGVNSTHICDFSSTSKLQLLKTGSEPCIDISLVDGERDVPPLLNLLTDSKLHVYKWVV